MVIGYFGRTFDAIASRPLGGVLEYCQAHPAVELHDFSLDDWQASPLDRPPPWKGLVDGALIASGFTGSTDSAIDWLESGGVPVVSVTSVIVDCRLPAVFTDPASVARLAVDELRRVGCGDWLFIGTSLAMGSRLRCEAFRRELARHGKQCTDVELSEVFITTPEAVNDPRQLVAHPEFAALAERLRAARKANSPLGVWTLNDRLARAVVTLATAEGLRVGRDVAVVGVDDTVVSFDRRPTITSSRCPGEVIGFKAMELLVKLMGGGRRPRKPILVPATELVARESTGASEGPDDVALALELIRREAGRGATIEELVDELPITRRTLERKFRQRLGRTADYELQRTRLAQIRTLLRHTRFSVQAIARRVGFADHGAMSRFFLRMTGMRPSDFRRTDAKCPM